MTDDALLDNPLWASLRSRHRAFAIGEGHAMRYPAAVAPFAAIPGEAGADAAVGTPALAALFAPGESLYLLGPRPPQLDGWRLDGPVKLAQMVCGAPVADVPGPAIVPLGAAQRDDVLALTARVYPHYFRPRTMDLGRYFGIYEDGRLAAMIGERMATDAQQEISAVCTDPDFLGRGLARRLMAFLGNDVLAQGRLPFLHVSQENARAVELYRRNGYRLRREIDFWQLQRPD